MAASVKSPRITILAIDIGSSSVRAGCYDENGAPVSGTERRRPYRFTYRAAGCVEADPGALVQLAAECVDEALAAPEAPAQVSAVVTCTFLHSLLGVSRDGTPTTPLLTWEDSRAARQAAVLAASPDAEEVRQRTGCPAYHIYAPARLAWFREHEPARFRESAWWGSFGEYCVGLFTGARACSLSMASATGLLDRRAGTWDENLLRTCGLDRGKLSPLEDLEPGARRLLPSWAARWPALKNARWMGPLGDGACSSVGCGCGVPGRAALMIGTTGAVRAVRGAGADPVPNGLWAYRLDRHRELVGGVLGDGGNLFQWMGETLSLDQDGRRMDAALLAAKPAGHGLVVLPFLSGERSTGWNPRARGAVIGLRQDSTALDILQAGMESVAYRFAVVVAALTAGLPGVQDLVGTGGALVSSDSWGQILADVLGMPLQCSAEREASSRGAALLALEALGAPAAGAGELRLERTFVPREGAAAAHRAAFAEHERCRAALYGSAPTGAASR